jgi:integrase
MRSITGVLSVAKAIEGALTEKSKSKRPAYLADLGKRWRRFERWLPADRRTAINGITRLDIRRFLNDCKLRPIGERNMLRNLSVLFSWAVNQHHMAENPCLGIVLEESTTRKSAVRILSIEEVRKLLHLVAEGFTVEADEREKNSWREKFGAISINVPPMDLTAIVAIGCFGRVRPEESARMTWNMVDVKRKHIDLPAEISKAGERRIVDMSDNLLEWLLPCRKQSGPLLPVNFRRKRWALCQEMNWKEWPDDILRHSYGSYHLAQHRNAALTAEQMGHKNVRMLYAHYREVVKEASHIEEY